MEHITELIHQAFAVFLFCISITVLLISYHSYLNTLNSAKRIQKNDIIYQQYQENEKDIAPRSEVIALLLHELDYDVEIDGILISKSEDTEENISSYYITHEKYLKSYAYDNDGIITRIIYKGL